MREILHLLEISVEKSITSLIKLNFSRPLLDIIVQLRPITGTIEIA